MRLEVIGVGGIGEVRPGDDLAALIADAVWLRDDDVVVVSQKVVSKAEGAIVDVPPGEDVAALRRRLARQQAVRVLVDAPQALVVQTRDGLVCANAGVDASNVPGGGMTLLPEDPDASARRLRQGLLERTGARVAVVVADTFGRPWRLGQTEVAIGAAGLQVLRDERGGVDRDGRRLDVTQVAVADELAAAADLVRRKADGVPVVVVRGFAVEVDEGGGARDLVRSAADDLFPRGRGWLAAALSADPEGWAMTTPVRPADLATALGAAGRAGDWRAEVTTLTPTSAPTVLGVRTSDGAPATPRLAVLAGAAAQALVAALLDLGYAARLRPPVPGEAAAVVVEAGGPGPAAPS